MLEILSNCLTIFRFLNQNLSNLFYTHFDEILSLGGGQATLYGFLFLLRWASAGVGLDLRRTAGAEASPRPQQPRRPWVVVGTARFACWMDGYLDPGSVEFSLRIAHFPQSFPFSISRSSQRFPQNSNFLFTFPEPTLLEGSARGLPWRGVPMRGSVHSKK